MQGGFFSSLYVSWEMLSFAHSNSQRKQLSKKFQFLENHHFLGNQELASFPILKYLQASGRPREGIDQQLVWQPRRQSISI